MFAAVKGIVGRGSRRVRAVVAVAVGVALLSAAAAAWSQTTSGQPITAVAGSAFTGEVATVATSCTLAPRRRSTGATGARPSAGATQPTTSGLTIGGTHTFTQAGSSRAP